ncbi:MAG: VCBS repeat-containing protein [Deltaproteobacteria bacterium]|nr:VCBS repeat-containing protein [Deltaproteobacteria bacterium]
MSIGKKYLLTLTAFVLLTGMASASVEVANKGIASDSLTVSTDFDGDGKGDLFAYDPSIGKFYVRRSSNKTVGSFILGGKGLTPTLGDFNGDGRGDLAVFSRTSGRWIVRLTGIASYRLTLGSRGDYPVPGDYLGLGCTQLATYNLRRGRWTIGSCVNPSSSLQVKAAAPTTVTFGGSAGGLMAVPSDYDCDGRTDLAVFNRYTARWTIKKSSNSATISFRYGAIGDMPVPADYRAQGCTQAAVYKLNTNRFYVCKDCRNGVTGTSYRSVQWGLLGDRPVLANPDGTPGANYIVYRPKEQRFYNYRSTNPMIISSAATALSGMPASLLPVSPLHVLNSYQKGDYNRDGLSDFATAEGNDSSATWKVRYSIDLANQRSAIVAAKGDALVPADYDGDGVVQPATVTAISADVIRWRIKNPSGSDTVVDYGKNGDKPLPGDFDCDGKADLAVVRKKDGIFLFWYMQLSSGTNINDKLFGLNADLPFVGDVDGDGCTEMVVARPTGTTVEWYYKDIYNSTHKMLSWGLPTDTVLSPMDMNGDNIDDFIVQRDVNGANVVYVRYSRLDKNSLSYPNFPWKAINFGLTGDVTAVGNYDGPGRAEVAVYRRSTPAYYWNKYRSQTVVVPHGAATDKVIRPDGTVVLPGETPGGGSNRCDVNKSPYDGASNGFTWKPHAEGGAYGGHPTVLIPSGYSSVRELTLLSSSGEELPGQPKFRYIRPEDGRPTFDNPMSASDMQDYAPITVLFNYGGSNVCYEIDDPSDRHD